VPTNQLPRFLAEIRPPELILGNPAPVDSCPSCGAFQSSACDVRSLCPNNSVALLLDFLSDALGQLAAWIAATTGRTSVPGSIS